MGWNPPKLASPRTQAFTNLGTHVPVEGVEWKGAHSHSPQMPALTPASLRLDPLSTMSSSSE